ncbi:MAG: hypothetical protein HYZ15_09385 [Sphingobacteriales bacterium]|nr:hypothetical protein [Sphingobacteriales bacterium]
MEEMYMAAGAFTAPISLNQLIKNLVDHSLPAAFQHHTRIVNEVDRELILGPGAEQLLDVLDELLEAVIRNSKEGDIHITADRYRDMVLLQIEERNNYNGYALSFSVGSIEPDAAKIGGHISIEGARKRQATISFSFPGQFAA